MPLSVDFGQADKFVRRYYLGPIVLFFKRLQSYIKTLISKSNLTEISKYS